MTVVARDGFTYSAPASSGAAPFTTVDNTVVELDIGYVGSPTTGDLVDYTLTFSTGTVTFRAEWTSSTTLVIKRISTIPGTNNGTATLQTFTGTSSGKPRTDGDLVRMRITVNRGAADSLTALTFAWHPRNTTSPFSTNTFSVDGELTPSAGAFAITGSSFYNIPDVDGMTPDGDGTPALAVGTYAVIGVTGGVGVPGEKRQRWGIDSDGDARPQIATFDDFLIALQGTGLSGDQAARGWAVFDAAASSSVIIGVRLSGLDFIGVGGNVSGYVCYAFNFGDDVALDLYKLDGGDFVFIDEVFTSTGVADSSTPHEIEIRAEGEIVTIAFDGADVLTYTDTGTAVLTGDGGFGGYRDGRTIAGIALQAFEVEDLSGGAPDPCGYPWSAHRFIGAVADIDGQITDTYPGQGRFAAHPSSAAVIAADWLQGRIVGAGRTCYVDADIPDLPNNYCVAATSTYPQSLTPGTPGSPCGYITQWRYKVTDGGGTVVEDGLTTDLSADNVWTRSSGTFTLTNLVLHDNGQPKSFDMEFTWNESEPEGNARIYVIFYATAHPCGAGLHSYGLNLRWSQLIDPTLYSVGSVPPGALYSTYGGLFQVNGTPVMTANVPLGPENHYPDHIYPPLYYPGGQPTTYVLTYSASGAVLITMEFQGEAATYAGKVAIEEWKLIRIDGLDGYPVGVPGTSGTDLAEQAGLDLLVRWDAAAATGYRLRQVFDHTGDVSTPTLEYLLEEVSAGVATLLRSVAPDLSLHPASHRVRLRAYGTLLKVVIDGLDTLTFDVATDDADETGSPVTDHTTGLPGLGGFDASGTGAYLIITDFEVDAETVPDVPCEGPPENSYPDPPPPEPPAAAIWRKTATVWLEIQAPTPEVPTQSIFPERYGGPLTALDMRIRRNAQWVMIGDLEQMPPPTSPFPPGYDPCEIYPPPDLSGITLDPYSGTRFFGLAGTPTTILDPDSIFGASQRTAELPFMLTELAAASVRGAVLVCAQGGYKKFIVNGWYSQTEMNRFIDSHIPYAATLLSYFTAGTLACIMIADDFRVQRLWPTSLATGGGSGQGLDDAELTRIAARWQAAVPGVALCLRARPRTFSGPIPGVTVYGTQFDGPMQVGKSIGQTVTEADYRAWRDAECGRLAAWGPSYQALMSPNWLHGGDGESGEPVYNGTLFSGRYLFSPAEVVRCADGWYGDGGGGYASRIIGNCGYLYDTAQLLAYPGMLAAMAYMRNGQQTL